MAKVQRLEGQVELNCSADKIFEMIRSKTPDISKLCSHKVPTIEAHQDDWVGVGTTRRWDLVIGEKSTYIVDRIEAIDEENMTMTRSVTNGEIMSHYKALLIHYQILSKRGNGKQSCIVKYSLEFEKVNQDAPEPKEFLDFGLGVFKELANHLSSRN